MTVLFSAKSPGISVSATTSASAAVILPASDGNSVRIVSEGPNSSFAAIGGSTVSATVPTSSSTQTSSAILPNADVVLRRDPWRDTHISVICRTGTATLTIYVGEGE